MGKHASISSEEAADRLAIRELVEAYAHCADRRDAKRQMALFTVDSHFVVYMSKGQDTFTRAALARRACCCFRRPEQVRSDHSLRRAEHDLHIDRRTS